jgi:uncharacterized protein YhaN
MSASREEMLRLISDLHKDARGFRPSVDRHAAYAAMPTAALAREWDGLCAELDRSMAHEAEAQARAAARFEARVADLRAAGAGDRATALRWLFQADDLAEDVAHYGLSYAAWEYGLASSYFEQPLQAAA